MNIIAKKELVAVFIPRREMNALDDWRNVVILLKEPETLARVVGFIRTVRHLRRKE